MKMDKVREFLAGKVYPFVEKHHKYFVGFGVGLFVGVVL